MTDADRKNMDDMMDRDPDMVSGTTGMGSDLDASLGGLSGDMSPSSTGTGADLDPDLSSGIGLDRDDMNDPSTVSGGPDMGGVIGGTGGLDTGSAPLLDSDAMDLGGGTDIDSDATVGRDTGMSAGIGEDAGDLADDPTGGMAGDMDADPQTLDDTNTSGY